MALTTALNLNLRATLTGTADLSTPTAEIAKTIATSLTSGTGLGAADQVFSDTRTLTTSSSETLDLAGSLTNDLGATISFARIKMIFINVQTTTAGYTLEVGGNASNQFINWVGDATDKIVVRGGGCFLLYTPDATAYAVTASTGDILKINNPSAGSVTYDIIIVGATA